jgi:flagellar M-ring protein FliF
LTADFAQSLRQTVAGGFGMAAPDVSVIDLRTGVALRIPDKHDSSSNNYIDAMRHHKAMHQQDIAEALLYIPNVLVSVNVEVDNLMQSREQERKYDAKAFPYKNLEQTDNETTNETGPGSEPGMAANQPRTVRQQAGVKNSRTVEKTTNSSESVPVGIRVAQREMSPFPLKSVQVAVAIPKDYYRSILLKQGADEADKAAFEAKLAQVRLEQEKIVKEKIAKLIPAPAGGTAADAINVSSYDRLETAEAPLPVSATTQIGEIVTQWGGPVGLALFALWALWMLNRSTKRMPTEPLPTASKPAAGKPAPALAAETEDEEEFPKEPTKRDKLQVLVKDNPEMAAAVLSRWLSPPK